MPINLAWVIYAFSIPPLLVIITRFVIIFELKKGTEKVSKIDNQKLNLAIANLRLDYDNKSSYRQLTLFILTIFYMILLGLFMGAYSTESFTLNPFYHGYSFFYGLMTLFSFSILQIYSFYYAKQNNKIWQTNVGKTFSNSHPQLLITSPKQKLYLNIARLFAAIISIFNLLYFYFNA